MDNQQERLGRLDFLGGLITGEGCFSLLITRNRKRGMVSPAFQMFMADKETVEIAYAILKNNRLPGYFETRTINKSGTVLYGIRCHGVKSLKRFCEALIPHLSGDKKQAAQNALDFSNYRLSLGAGAGYSPVDVDYIKKMRDINGNKANKRIELDDLPRILRDYTFDIPR